MAETVTLARLTVTGQDRYGRDVTTTSQEQSVGWVLWPTGLGSEQTQGQDITTDNVTALAPVGTDLSAIDAVVWRGRTYQVQGNTWAWSNPFTGTAPGVQVELKAVSG